MLGSPLLHLFSKEYGPFDRLLEIGVFLLILYEVVSSIRLRRSDQSRRTLLGQRAMEISRLTTKGLRLKAEVPDPAQHQQDYRPVLAWEDAVRSWAQETNSFLARHSASASAIFLTIMDSASVESAITYSGVPFRLTSDLREIYQRLVVQLSNLAQIARTPEAYF